MSLLLYARRDTIEGLSGHRLTVGWGDEDGSVCWNGGASCFYCGIIKCVKRRESWLV